MDPGDASGPAGFASVVSGCRSSRSCRCRDIERLAKRAGATLRQAVSSALFSVSSSAAASTTLVQPCRPQPPGTGAKIAGSAPVSISCCSWVSLTTAVSASGSVAKDVVAHPEIRLSEMRLLFGFRHLQRQAAHIVGVHGRALAAIRAMPLTAFITLMPCCRAPVLKKCYFATVRLVARPLRQHHVVDVHVLRRDASGRRAGCRRRRCDR